MKGKFITANEVEWDQLDWGDMGWLSRPATTGAKAITVMEVAFKPSGGHNFHHHPNQEEVIYVMSGEIEQWLEHEKRILKAGDSIFIHAGVVHASFNVSATPAKLIVVLGPCDGESGYTVVEVGNQAPWNTLR